ncbi:transposase [Phytomonospora endophytica]|nr:transposase [Phytomonospora endophytica]
MKRAYRYRFYPTGEQAALLTRTFGCVRFVWNKALEERTRRHRDLGLATNYVETAHWLTAWKQDADTAFLAEVSNVPLQQALRHLQSAFSRFHARLARYPRFKTRHRGKASATFQSNAFRFRDGRLHLAKLAEPLDIVWSRPLPAGVDPTTVTVSRDAAGRWFVSMLVEERLSPAPPVEGRVGIGTGANALITLSTGEKITVPRQERADRRRLARARRTHDRTTPGSRNRAKARVKVARIQARIADRRSDHLHKVTTSIVRENQTIVIEDLGPRDTAGDHDQGTSDAGRVRLRSLLEYKAAWWGRTLRVVDRWYPSAELCSTAACGHLNTSLPPSARSWKCPRCGVLHDRDLNTARNVLAAGLAES